MMRFFSLKETLERERVRISNVGLSPLVTVRSTPLARRSILLSVFASFSLALAATGAVVFLAAPALLFGWGAAFLFAAMTLNSSD